MINFCLTQNTYFHVFQRNLNLNSSFKILREIISRLVAFFKPFNFTANVYGHTFGSCKWDTITWCPHQPRGADTNLNSLL